jgi:Zn finger protein HypA/HybF involved in hydrogenase expression
MKIRCVLCGRELTDRGLEILGNSICSSCEDMVVELDSGDEQYVEYARRLKVIWQGII